MTLIELMVSLSIASLLTTIALPNLQGFIVKLRVDNEISRLSRLLLIARNHALTHDSNVIICPLDNSSSCSTNWHNELSVFIDNNNNQQFDSATGERVVAHKAAVKLGDILIFAQNRNKITYQATGHLFGLSNGTLKYCPKGYQDYSRGIVLATSGRFYATHDINHDGVDETRSNVEIICY